MGITSAGSRFALAIARKGAFDEWRDLAGRGGLARALLAVAAVWAVAVVGAPAAAALSPPRMYWANQDGTIGQANVDGTGLNQSFITGGNAPFGMALDSQHIYWTNVNGASIGMSNRDGSAVNQSFITGGDGPTSVAVNRQHIYWANEYNDTIGRANLDGPGVNQSFITGADGPFGVAVDSQHIYWTNSNASTIGKANLDGTAVNLSLITGANLPTGVAVDGQHIYWANTRSNTIGVANLDGAGVNHSFISGASSPYGLAVDGQHIYWANYASGTIGVANRDGTDVNPSLVTGATSPHGVALWVPVADVTPASPPAFASTPQGTLGPPLTLTISNPGQRDLSVTGLSFTGTDPGDFIVGSNSCLGSVAPGETCQLTVSFAPQGTGARSATLEIASNDYVNSPLEVPLSGTGSSPPAALTGSAEPTTATGATGPARPRMRRARSSWPPAGRARRP